MKKLLLPGIAVLLFLMLSNSAFAALGIKAGLARATQNYNYTENITLDPNYISGFDVGLSFQFISLPSVGLLIEGHYIQKGMQIDLVDTSGPEPTNIVLKNRLNYLSFPALAKVSLLGFYALAGVRADVLLSKDVDEGFESIYDNFETFVTGYDIGIGYQLGIIPAISPLIELRYSGDFKDSYQSDTLSINNKSYQLLLGVMF